MSDQSTQLDCARGNGEVSQRQTCSSLIIRCDDEARGALDKRRKVARIRVFFRTYRPSSTVLGTTLSSPQFISSGPERVNNVQRLVLRCAVLVWMVQRIYIALLEGEMALYSSNGL